MRSVIVQPCEISILQKKTNLLLILRAALSLCKGVTIFEIPSFFHVIYPYVDGPYLKVILLGWIVCYFQCCHVHWLWINSHVSLAAQHVFRRVISVTATTTVQTRRMNVTAIQVSSFYLRPCSGGVMFSLCLSCCLSVCRPSRPQASRYRRSLATPLAAG